MIDQSYTPLQMRELFHLEFLRRLSRKLKPDQFSLKGGVNMRFFFRSPRYSEDLDIDAEGLSIDKLRDTVTMVLAIPSLSETLLSFGIRAIVPPDIAKAKQTETTQRFKIHLRVAGDLDLFTKVEFSRRGMQEGIVVESIPAMVTKAYRVPPVIVPHYGAAAAFAQKVGALADRALPQARDVFDLHLLHTQLGPVADKSIRPAPRVVRKALDNLFSVEYRQFRDTVLEFLDHENRRTYEDPGVWDEIRLTVSRRLEELL
jgi:predicted nucleotidyltransferase component of viral defense system